MAGLNSAFGVSNVRTMIVKDAVYPKMGNLLNYDATSGAGTVDLTANTDACFFIALDESSRDADNTLVASGATITCVPVGGMAAVLATSGESWVAGQVLYVAASGLATKTAGSNKILGHYLGSAATTDATTLYDVNTKQTN
jgi:predicted RecA/RadA family phage recombinase